MAVMTEATVKARMLAILRGEAEARAAPEGTRRPGHGGGPRRTQIGINRSTPMAQGAIVMVALDELLFKAYETVPPLSLASGADN